MPAQSSVKQLTGWLEAVVILGRKITDREDHAHNLRVARLCVHIGRQMSMSAKELRLLARVGLLHDIGNLRLPDGVLDKKAPLDAAEWQLVRTHPELGVSLIDRAGRSSRELRAVLYHHERLDGSGYPYGLKGDAIPIEARILAVADTFDALTSERPHRKAVSPAQARRVMQKEAGVRLDARAVAALFARPQRGPARSAAPARRALAY